MTLQRFALSLALVGTAATHFAPVHAATIQNSFGVTLKVTNKCVFGAGSTANIDLGEANALTPPSSENSGTASFSLQCSKGTAYSITLTPTPRNTAGLVKPIQDSLSDNMGMLTIGNDANNRVFVPYNLYSDAAFSKPWGKKSVLSDVALSSVMKTYTVYVQAGTSPDLQPGNYTDRVTISVNY